jgi:hypothetical protein
MKTWRIIGLVAIALLYSVNQSYARARAVSDILRDLVARAPRYMPARILLAENLALFVHWHRDPNVELFAEARDHLVLVKWLAPQTPGLASMVSDHA